MPCFARIAHNSRTTAAGTVGVGRRLHQVMADRTPIPAKYALAKLRFTIIDTDIRIVPA